MSDRLTTRNEHGDAILCDRLQGIGICLNDDVERVAQYEDELEARRWISVEEKLPEELFYHSLVAYVDDDGDALVGIAAYQGDGKWSGISFYEDEGEITHWMPLPAPPEN